MKEAALILAIQISIVQTIFACGCGGPKNILKIDIDSTDVIFIGIITKINKEHLFHLNNGAGTGLKFINFDILKIYKGINVAQLKVSLFDSHSNSSCEGIISGKMVGDTVLVFANEFNADMIASYICGRHPTFQRLTAEESNFIDTAKWIDPRTKYDNLEHYLKIKFPESNNQIRQGKEPKSNVTFCFYLSLGLNLILSLLLIRKIINSDKTVSLPDNEPLTVHSTTEN